MGVRIRSEGNYVIMEVMDGNGGVKVRERRRVTSEVVARAIRDVTEAIADNDQWDALAYLRKNGVPANE